ncbi:MAG: MFS transporter [Muribaculaceae bacterium]|nr:MFS transporter [Muribaculaceae bacterium]
MAQLQQTKLIDMADMPLGKRHIWIVFVASLGQLIGTGVATLAGILIPLLNIITRPELSSAMQGIIGAADLVGIAIGSVIIGKLIDKYGYILLFRLCPLIVLVASVISIIFPDITVLIICLFIIGVGIGGEYSLDSNYISELMPVKWKSFMVGLAKAASAFGNIIVAGICFLIIERWKTATTWPELMWIVVAISGLMVVCRIWFYQSPKWLEHHGRPKEAEEMLQKFLGNDVVLPPEETAPATPQTVSESSSSDTSLASRQNPAAQSQSCSFLKRNWKKIILTGIPWACEGLGVYGIGVFLPILVMSLGIEAGQTYGSPLHHVSSSVLVTFFISCIILPGFLLGLWLIQKRSNICRMQVVGFALCGIFLIILLLAYRYHWGTWISIVAFMAFELFLNMGPHLVTFVLPPKVYPVATRGFGTGIAASLGKVGAVLGVFFIPVLMHSGGASLVLIVSAIVMFVGAFFTFAFRKSATLQ